MVNDQQGVAPQQQPSPSVVGWVGTAFDGINDTTIPAYCSRIGSAGYSFLNYPIGGMTRDQWRAKKNESPPPINLPDWQLKPQLWSTYVIGRISSWIDCDSNEAWLADLSAVEIEKELAYMSFMPLRVLTLELKHRDSPRLASILTKWFWTQTMNFCIWVFVPTDENCLPVSGKVDKRDIWAVWADFRTLCTNYSIHRLAVGLRICPDLADEFLEPKLYRRWNAEPLCSFWVDSSVFVHGATQSDCVLTHAHYCLLSDLFVSMAQRALVCASSTSTTDYVREMYVGVLKRLVDLRIRQAHEASGDSGDNVLLEYLGHPEYVDALQIPLQPLADNLDSGTYTTFEEDSVKYDKYREAIGYAIDELVDKLGHDHQIIVFLLGAGRGPLMQMIMDAEMNFNKKNRTRHDLLELKLVAVEKNVNAVVTLKYRNCTEWGERVIVIESDMRELSSLVRSGEIEQPDLIVSELLGSFGDNELSPECLDGVNDIIKKTTISIPKKYISYVAPIQSVRMHQKVLACMEGKYFDKGLPSRGRLMPQKQPDGSYALPMSKEVSPLDEIYVVYLRSICPLDDPKPVFTFTHPNFERTPNTRQQVVHFEVDKQCELMGFAAYFEAQLYGSCWLSTHPVSHTKSMIDFHIERKVDEGGVWYEWFVEYKDMASGETKRTALQNQNGMSYYMRL
uniref:Protein arginine N-methyltransferase n=1 Tax=Parascaris univalens TaxID=6257 RepID=A0A915AKN3_PARUN